MEVSYESQPDEDLYLDDVSFNCNVTDVLIGDGSDSSISIESRYLNEFNNTLSEEKRGLLNAQAAKEGLNLLNQQYASTAPNYAVAIDVTYLKNDVCAFVAIDLHAKLILGHTIKPGRITSVDVIMCLEIIFKERSETTPFCIVHCDNESIFKSKVFLDFLTHSEILVSYTGKNRHSNQIVEREFNSIKSMMLQILIREHDFVKTTQKGIATHVDFSLADYELLKHVFLRSLHFRKHQVHKSPWLT